MKMCCPVFIAGPTASGKSAVSLGLAATQSGEIVNADAIQIYCDLNVITARPTHEDEAIAPHHLYGVLDGAERCSAGRWALMAKTVVEEISAHAKVVLVAGGTGLYFKVLEEGLSPIPDISDAARAKAVARREELGPAAFQKEVVDQDPAMARLPEGDAQRLVRAWEVFYETGQPLSYFQSLPRQPIIEQVGARIIIEPPRDVLYARCDARAAAMMDDGAVEEVRAIVARDLDPGLPVMKALGVPEIAAMLRGDLSADEALEQLQQNTRRFAKRQLTWFRNQAPDWPRAESVEEAEKILIRELCAKS